MAGIGFELKRFLTKDNYLGILSAYSYAGIVCSGPWLLSIAAILLITMMARLQGLPLQETLSFQGIIIYLIAGSLILSAVFQHSYTRYIADECYKKRQDQIIPTLNAVYCYMILLSVCIGGPLVYFLLPDETNLLRFVTLISFIVLGMIWVTTSLLSGLLEYKTIFTAFLANFIIVSFLGYFLNHVGVIGLLTSFLIGQFILLMILIYVIYKNYPTAEFINYAFFKAHHAKRLLILSGVFYNLGIWIDKIIFWYHPSTGEPIIGRLYHASVYDTPIFLAYLAVVPGMALFLLHLETEFEDAYSAFYNKVRGKDTFGEIQKSYYQLLKAGRGAILSIIKAQIYLFLVAITAGSFIFYWLNISSIYLPLFLICLVAAFLNLIFWAMLDIIFYLDKIKQAVGLTFLFLVSNVIFTLMSIQMGIYYFGYGLGFSLLLTVSIAFFLLNREVENLEYETYMLN